MALWQWLPMLGVYHTVLAGVVHVAAAKLQLVNSCDDTVHMGVRVLPP